MTEATASQSGPIDPPVDMLDLVEAIAKSLVDAPEQVSVQAIQDGESTILRLRVAPGDLGKVIGRQGRTARSFRTILGAAVGAVVLIVAGEVLRPLGQLSTFIVSAVALLTILLVPSGLLGILMRQRP